MISIFGLKVNRFTKKYASVALDSVCGSGNGSWRG